VHEVDEMRVGTTVRAVTGRRSRGPDRLMPSIARNMPIDAADQGREARIAVLGRFNQWWIAN
jgi:hypothetical protein